MRVIHDRERDTREHRYSQNKDEITEYKIDFSRLMTERETSASNVTWEAVNGAATIANNSLSSDIATADITASKQGMAQIKVTATQADGNNRIVWLKIQCIDPEYSTKDYV